jgi:hypothetical protein
VNINRPANTISAIFEAWRNHGDVASLWFRDGRLGLAGDELAG